jgi:hypothetical protein
MPQGAQSAPGGKTGRDHNHMHPILRRKVRCVQGLHAAGGGPAAAHDAQGLGLRWTGGRRCLTGVDVLFLMRGSEVESPNAIAWPHDYLGPPSTRRVRAAKHRLLLCQQLVVALDFLPQVPRIIGLPSACRLVLVTRGDCRVGAGGAGAGWSIQGRKATRGVVLRCPDHRSVSLSAGEPSSPRVRGCNGKGSSGASTLRG